MFSSQTAGIGGLIKPRYR